jgi:hypothetical protein
MRSGSDFINRATVFLAQEGGSRFFLVQVIANEMTMRFRGNKEKSTLKLPGDSGVRSFVEQRQLNGGANFWVCQQPERGDQLFGLAVAGHLLGHALNAAGAFALQKLQQRGEPTLQLCALLDGGNHHGKLFKGGISVHWPFRGAGRCRARRISDDSFANMAQILELKSGVASTKQIGAGIAPKN